MKDKILFWLDAVLTYFCLAYFMQQKVDSDFFAIIDVFEKPKIFFQNQKLIKFQKTWYYHDYFQNINSPNLEYLSNFERKYDINLWQLVINERIFYRFNRIHKFSSNEILSILEQECRLFEKILDEINPEFLITHEPALHHQELLYQICKKIGVKTLVATPPNMGRLIISQEPRKLDIAINLNEITSSNRTFKELQEYRKSFSTSQIVKNYTHKFKTSKLELLKSTIEFLSSENQNIKTHYTHRGRTKFRILKDEIKSSLKKKFRTSFINHNLETEMKIDEKFVYFPLSVDEERNLLIAAPFYTNQLEVIRHITKSLPPDYTLYIKENPAQSIRYWRSISEYRDIMNIPNVRLFHPSFPAENLLEKCSLVITIGGSSGLDAAFYEKPSIVFSDLGYSVLPSVHKLNSIQDLPKVIRKSLEIKVNSIDLDRYLTFLHKNSFDFNLVDFENKYNEFFYHGGHLLSVDIPEFKMKEFLEKNESSLEKFTLEHIKKIQELKNQQKS